MKRARPFSAALALGPLLFAGCTVGPNYSRPDVATPAAWKESPPAATAPSAPQTGAWWEIFGDTELAALEAQVIASNQDLQRAAARIAAARALARVSEADLYPNLSAGVSNSRFRTSANRAPASPAVEASDHAAQFDLSYELDFWGRVRRVSEAARAEAAVAVDDYHVAQLTLTADAARDYFQLRSLDAEHAILEATLALRRDEVRLQETRNQAGLINEVDVTRARTEAANVEAELHAIARDRARTEHALAILCGKSPAEFSVAARAATTGLPAVPAGLPSSLLQRRPDLAAAEHELHAACARIGVAKADFLPRVSLTGSAGFASAELSSLTASDSRAWSIGPSVHLPLFDGGRNRANLAAAQANYDAALAAYRGAALTAFREVEDALSDHRTLALQAEAVQRALASARDTAALANERYQRGLSNYLDVVDAQRAVLQTERLDRRLQLELTLSAVQLTKALGGGWSANRMKTNAASSGHSPEVQPMVLDTASSGLALDRRNLRPASS
ncbi:MAG TPA: efflux transporter outer membrane subunit [Opitutus sp.]|nr:efflux transporter outer membrane subunit [Opitutus sp.]